MACVLSPSLPHGCVIGGDAPIELRLQRAGDSQWVGISAPVPKAPPGGGRLPGRQGGAALGTRPHSYDLSRYGLTRADVESAFAGYNALRAEVDRA
jgi:hypothetical protein